MRRSGNGSLTEFLKSKYNRAIVIVLEVAALLTVIVLTCFVLSGDLITSAQPESTMYILQSTTAIEASNIYEPLVPQVSGSNTVPVTGNNTTPSINAGNNLGGGGASNTGGEGSGNQTLTLENPSGWSRAQILAKATSAVNKTKAYKEPLTVHHRETFDADVTEASGGTIVQSVANMMVGWVVQPVEETLNYSNGKAVNSEGETVPIILPKRNDFYLGESGVTSAEVKLVNNEYVINISLVEENVGMNDVPQHNASAIGYLDVANFDLSFLTVDSANITYKGSSLELHINANGYVTYAEYHIPLNIEGSGHSGSISGSVTFDGEQTEIWTLNY